MQVIESKISALYLPHAFLIEQTVFHRLQTIELAAFFLQVLGTGRFDAILTTVRRGYTFLENLQADQIDFSS